MRFMMIVKADAESEAGHLPDVQVFEDMARYNEALARAGVLVSAEGLHPSARGFRVRFDGPARTVLDGPFTETKELIAGFWLIDVPSRADAVAWARRIPCETGEIEVREVFDRACFAQEIAAKAT